MKCQRGQKKSSGRLDKCFVFLKRFTIVDDEDNIHNWEAGASELLPFLLKMNSEE